MLNGSTPKAVSFFRSTTYSFQHHEPPVPLQNDQLSMTNSPPSSNASSYSSVSTPGNSRPSSFVGLSSLLQPLKGHAGMAVFHTSHYLLPTSWSHNHPQHKPSWSGISAVNNPVALPQHVLQRPRSISSLSKPTHPTSDDVDTMYQGNSEQDEEDHLWSMDSIDGTTSDEQDDTAVDLVASLQRDSCINNLFKPTFFEHDSILPDKSGITRKIADLRVENAALLAINTTLETTVQRQASRIAELQAQLQSKEPGCIVLDRAHQTDMTSMEETETEWICEHIEADLIYLRVKKVIHHLITEAEVAIVQQAKLPALLEREMSKGMREALKEQLHEQRKGSPSVVQRLSIRRSSYIVSPETPRRLSDKRLRQNRSPPTSSAPRYPSSGHTAKPANKGKQTIRPRREGSSRTSCSAPVIRPASSSISKATKKKRSITTTSVPPKWQY
ncbi:uncharacterized protein BYT42DRAFT_574346 [Radiomyces spectabilis]|uniref:uncharacterized protein n=1 Tax=Radiomyces spectabilis TaxID=64574 RepID=UPI00221F6363|nr:uncharacterized protein BYT42DRAFT_574346 [Radiomyces spectabilis]KAI8376368.1 hypothetical protein BYT42DRAFT_574346 [Radiomyces spectabilis]